MCFGGGEKQPAQPVNPAPYPWAEVQHAEIGPDDRPVTPAETGAPKPTSGVPRAGPSGASMQTQRGGNRPLPPDASGLKM